MQLTDYLSRGFAVSPDGEQIVSVLLGEQVTPKRWRIAIMPPVDGPPAKVGLVPDSTPFARIRASKP